MKVNNKGDGNFEQPEVGSYAAVCNKIIDLGTQKGEWKGKPNKQRKMIIGWEIDEKMKNGDAFTVLSFYTASLGKKTRLLPDLEAWRGRKFTPEELAEFDTKNLIGKPCMVSLIKNDEGRIKVQSVSMLPRSMQAPRQTKPNVYFSLTAFDQSTFDTLSEKIQDMIKESPEYQAIASMSGQIIGAKIEDEIISTPENDEETPF